MSAIATLQDFQDAFSDSLNESFTPSPSGTDNLWNQRTRLCNRARFDIYGRVNLNITKSFGSFVLYPAPATPAVPTGVAASGGSLPANTYYYVITAINPANGGAGETLPSVELVIPATLNQKITLTWSVVVGATGYKIYRGTSSGGELLLATIASGSTNSYVDTGSVTPAGGLPAADTTATYNCPADFEKRTSLFFLKSRSGGIEYTDPYEPTGKGVSITQNFTTGLFQITFSPAPAAQDFADFIYFANPAKVSAAGDLLIFRGEAILFRALYLYRRMNNDDIGATEDRTEYENQVAEITRDNNLTTSGKLRDMRTLQKVNHQGTDERTFYQGNRRTMGG